MSANDFPLAHRLSHIERLVDVIDLPIGRWDTQHRLVFCNEPYVGWADRPRDERTRRAWSDRREARAEAESDGVRRMREGEARRYPHGGLRCGHFAS